MTLLSKSGVSRLIRNSYLLNNLYAELNFRLDPLYKRRPLIIYQMGKVGSETVERSLAACGLGRPIYRAHALVAEHIAEGLRAANLTPRQYFARSRHGFHGQQLARQLARDLHKGHWQVITMVRDPVAQNVSSFFQIVDMLIPGMSKGVDAPEPTTEELMDVFLANYPPDGVFVTWFDVEMKPSFGVDVFASPFSHDNGYQIYRQPHVDLLLMRLEDLDRCAPAAFKEFLDVDDFRIVNRNESKDKGYYDLYRRFRAEAVFPHSYVDAVYGSKYARHFYSAAEIDRFRGRLRIGS
jgi:hypothetical protein